MTPREKWGVWKGLAAGSATLTIEWTDNTNTKQTTTIPVVVS